MIELTKDNVVITSDGDIFIPVIGFRDIKSRLPKGKKLKQQIVDDYEKSRKYDKNSDLNCPVCQFDYEWTTIFQNQKLRESIEEKIEDFASRKLPHVVIHELQKLLKESKK